MFKLNITFHFECYLHHNCSVSINWNNTQLCSSAKPLHHVPSSVLWFANFCFFPFLSRTSIQVLLCTQVNRLDKNVGKDIKVSVSKSVYRSSSTNQSCVQRSRNPHNFEKGTYKNIFRLFEDSASKSKAFNLKVNCKELKLVFIHHKKVYLTTWDCWNKLILCTFIQYA